MISRLSSCSLGSSTNRSSKKCTRSRRPSLMPQAVPAGSSADAARPISSASSRRAAASGISPRRMPPPGKCHSTRPNTVSASCGQFVGLCRRLKLFLPSSFGPASVRRRVFGTGAQTSRVQPIGAFQARPPRASRSDRGSQPFPIARKAGLPRLTIQLDSQSTSRLGSFL